MPGMNGIDFIKHVALLGYRSALLIISGYDGKTLNTISEMAGSLGIGSTRFLSKPYSAEAFLAALNGIFSDLERAYRCSSWRWKAFSPISAPASSSWSWSRYCACPI